MMEKLNYEMRVKRLVESGLCPAKNASKYVKALQNLTNKMDSDALKMQSKIFKALSDTSRLKILALLRIRDMCVCEIMVALNMTQPVASHHLGILENIGIVEYRRKGKWIFYSVSKPDFVDFLDEALSLV
jgi:ArsR family transcriptional regulator